MAKIITDPEKIAEVLTRGVENIFPDKESLSRVLQSGRRLKLYCGFDPSAPSLHIGNAIQINKLAQFQALGHEVIFLIGDFTGMIGDPTDKQAARKKLTREQVVANSRNYHKQASAYLDFTGENPAKILYNSAWSDLLTFRDLIELTANFTVQQMIQRDMFQARLKEEKPIYMHEFLYPVAQGYDSVAMDVDLEVGGNDQMFNMLCGRDLIRILKKKEKFVMTNKLLIDPSGKKMGKSEGNIIKLDETPENMYGQVMAWPDGLIAPAFEMATKVPLSELREINKQLAVGVNPRDLKMRLAREFVSLNYGADAARSAEENFIKVIQKKEAPDRLKEIFWPEEKAKIAAVLVKSGLAASGAEAKRLIAQGAVKLDDQVVNDSQAIIDIPPAGCLIKKGKLGFIRLHCRPDGR